MFVCVSLQLDICTVFFEYVVCVFFLISFICCCFCAFIFLFNLKQNAYKNSTFLLMFHIEDTNLNNTTHNTEKKIIYFYFSMKNDATVRIRRTYCLVHTFGINRTGELGWHDPNYSRFSLSHSQSNSSGNGNGNTAPSKRAYNRSIALTHMQRIHHSYTRTHTLTNTHAHIEIQSCIRCVCVALRCFALRVVCLSLVFSLSFNSVERQATSESCSTILAHFSIPFSLSIFLLLNERISTIFLSNGKECLAQRPIVIKCFRKAAIFDYDRLVHTSKWLYQWATLGFLYCMPGNRDGKFDEIFFGVGCWLNTLAISLENMNHDSKDMWRARFLDSILVC